MLKNLKELNWLKIVLEIVGIVLILSVLDLDSIGVIEFCIGYVFLKIVILFEIYEV